jgi:hypothetical protein
MRRVTLIASLETAPGEPKLIRTVRGSFARYTLKGA